MSKPGGDGGGEEYYQYSEDPDDWFKLPVHEDSYSDESDDEEEKPTPKTPLTKRKRLPRRRNRFYKPWYSRGGTGAPPFPYGSRQPTEVTDAVTRRINFDSTPRTPSSPRHQMFEGSWSNDTNDVFSPSPFTPFSRRRRPKVKRDWFHKPWYTRKATGVPPYPFTRSQPPEVTRAVAQRLNFDLSSSGSEYNRPFLPSGYSWHSSDSLPKRRFDESYSSPKRRPTSASTFQGSGSSYETFSGSDPFSGSERQGPAIVYRPPGYQSDIPEERSSINQPYQPAWGGGVTFRERVPSGPISRRRHHYRQIASWPAARWRQRRRTRGEQGDWGQNEEYDAAIAERLDSLALE